MVGKARPGKLTEVTQIAELQYSAGEFLLIYDETEENNFTIARLEDDLMDNEDEATALFFERVKENRFKVEQKDTIRSKYIISSVSTNDLEIVYDTEGSSTKKEKKSSQDEDSKIELRPIKELTIKSKPYKSMITNVKRFRLPESEEEEDNSEDASEDDKSEKSQRASKEPAKTVKIVGKAKRSSTTEAKSKDLKVKSQASKRAPSSDEEEEDNEDKPKTKSSAKQQKKKQQPQQYKKGKWNPSVTLREKCEQLESEATVPNFECSTRNSNRELIRAGITGNKKLLDNILDSDRKISRVTETWGLQNTMTAFKALIDRGDIETVIYILDRIKPRHNSTKKEMRYGHDNIVYLQKIDTGYNDKYAYGVATRKVSVSRGGRQGNNAFVEETYAENDFDAEHVKYFLCNKVTTPNLVKRFLAAFPHMEHLFISKVGEILRSGGRRDVADYLIELGTKKDGYGLGEFFHLALVAKSEKDLKDLKKINCTKKAFAVDNIVPMTCACLNPNPDIIRHFIKTNQDEYQIIDSSLRKLSHYAACCESPEPLKVLIERGVDPKEHDNHKKNALFYAAEAGRNETVKLLVPEKINPSLKDKSSNSALHYAAIRGHIDVVETLITKGGVKIALPGADRMTALHLAAAYNHYDLVKFLVESGAKVLCKDKFKRTPLVLACKNGNLKIASYLLQHGAPFDEPDSSGNTPLHYACAYGYPEVIDVLLEAGSDPNLKNSWALTPTAVALLKSYFSCLRRMLEDSRTDVNCVDDEGRTLVSNAVKTVSSENLNHITFLLREKKADPNIADAKGLTAFDYLCSHNLDSLYLQATKYENLKNLTLEEMNQRKAEITSLYKKYFKLFIDCKADINHRDLEGLTPVFRTLEFENIEGFKMLLQEKQLELDIVSKSNHSIFHSLSSIVAKDGFFQSAQLLLAKCNKSQLLNLYSDEGQTPLHTVMLAFISQVGQMKNKFYTELERELRVKKINEGKGMDVEGGGKGSKKHKKRFTGEGQSDDDEGEDEDDEDQDDDGDEDDDNNYKGKKMKFTGLKGGARKSFARRQMMMAQRREMMQRNQEMDKIAGIMITEAERAQINDQAERMLQDKIREFLDFLTLYQKSGGDPLLVVKQPKKPKRVDENGQEIEEDEDDIPADFLTYFANLINNAVKDKFDLPEKDKPGKSVGYTLLHLAMNNPQPKLIKFLIDNFKIRLNQKSVYGETEILKYIDSNGDNPESIAILETLIASGGQIEQSNCRSVTPLLLAVKLQKYNFVNMLVARGVNINSQDCEGNYPLLQAIKNKNLDAVEKMLKAGANPNLIDENKRNSIHWAINLSAADADASNEIENALLSSGGQINAVDIKGRTPLHYAFVKIGSPLDYTPIDPIETVSNIISRKGVIIDIRDKWGNTPLNYAAQRGSVISALYLLQNKADINNVNGEGNTPLNEALVNGHQNMCIFLIQKNADLNIDVRIRTKQRRQEILDDEKADEKEHPEEADDEGNGYAKRGFGFGFGNRTAMVNAAYQFKRKKMAKRKKKGMDVEGKKEDIEYDSSESELEKPEANEEQKLEEEDEDEDNQKSYPTNRFNTGGGFFGNQFGSNTGFGYSGSSKSGFGMGYQLPHEQQGIVPVQFRKGEKVASTFSVAIRRNWQSVAFLMLQFKFDLTLAILDCFNFEKYNYVYTLLLKMDEAGVYQMTNNLGQNLTHLFAKNSRKIETTLFDKILVKLEAKNLDFGSLDKFGRNSLHYACEAGNIKFAYTLLNKKLSPNTPDNNGMTPLGLIITKWFGQVVEFVKFGKSYGLDVNKPFTVEKKAHTCLTYIVYKDLPFDVFTKLVDLGADVNKGDSDGWVPVVHFIRQNKDEEVKMFLKTFKNFDARVKDKEGKTLIHHVVKPREFGAFENSALLEMLAPYCDVNQKDNSGHAPIYYAKAQDSGKMLKSLLKVKAKEDSMEEPGLQRTSTAMLASVDFPTPYSNYEEDFDKFVEKCKEEAAKKKDEFEEKCPVDPNATGNYEVVMDGDLPFDCYMVKVDISYGYYSGNTFYKMQILREKIRDIYIVFTRWGRVGTDGQYQQTPFSKLEEAKKEFSSIFKSKTGNLWEERLNFKKVDKKYRLVPVHKQHRVENFLKAFNYRDSRIPDTKLEHAVFKLIRRVCNYKTISTALRVEFNIDETVLPLQSLTKERLLDAEAVLKSLAKAIEHYDEVRNQRNDLNRITQAAEEISKLSSEFYELIPTAGNTQESIPPIMHVHALNEMQKKIQNLIYFEVAIKLLSAASFNINRINPVDYIYRALNTKIVRLAPETDEYKIVK
jgi:ankyrin repeat protein/predicted DNA-binding WGR domain protein